MSDRLRLLVQGGTGGAGQIRLDNVASVDRVRFEIQAGTQELPSLSAAANSEFIVSGGAVLNVPQLDSPTNFHTSVIGSGSRLAIGGSLDYLTNDSLTAAGGGRMVVGGDLSLRQTSESLVNLATGLLEMSGSSVQYLEVGGLDLGLGGTAANNNGNFGIGQLVVGATGRKSTVVLTDAVDNGNRDGSGGFDEALYLFGLNGDSGLRLTNNATLALNGLNVYAWDAVAGAQVHLNSLFAPGILSIDYDGGTLQLYDDLGPFVWNGPGGGEWTTPANWSPDFVPDGDFKVVFGNTLTAPATITLGESLRAGRLTFNSPHAYSIAGTMGTSLELVSGVIEVGAGTHTVSASLLSSSGLTKTGAGTLVLAGANSIAGNVNVEQGILRAGAPSLAGFSQLTVASAATFDMRSSSVFQINSGQTLTGRGTIRANKLALTPGSAMRGTLQTQGTLVNNGLVAPGFSPAIMTVVGDYSQQPGGVLEMELGGTTPGIEHDMLIVTGTASLAGRLEMPVIDGYVPQIGDSMQLILAGNVVGSFDSHHISPSLVSLNPQVAYEVVTTGNGVRINFVETTEDQFDGTAASSNWSEAMNWASNTVPTSRDIVTVANMSASTQRLDVEEVPMLYPKNAFSHQLTVMGSTEPMAIDVEAGSSLSATVGVKLEQNGLLQLNGGSVVTSEVRIVGGGLVAGRGEIVGNVVVGETSGTLQGTFDPQTLADELVISGNYVQRAAGELAIEISGTNSGHNHDTLTINGNATLGGRLTIDVSNLSEAEFVPGARYTLGTVAGNLSGGFDAVEVVGRDDIYFAVSYGGPGALVLEGGAITVPQQFTAEGYFKGDGNQDGVVDDLDVAVFAAVLMDPTIGEFRYMVDGQPRTAAANFLDAFDFYHEGAPAGFRIIDFDDAPLFADALARHQGTTLANAQAAIAAAIAAAQHARTVPEPATFLLCLVAVPLIWKRMPRSLKS